MKMFNILPQGAASAIAKAAKVQRAQEMVRKIAIEVAERKDAEEQGLLMAIEEYQRNDPRKALSLIDLHKKKFPQSCVAHLVESVRVHLVDVLAERKARGIHNKVVIAHERKSSQGLPIIEKIPAEWSR